MHFGSMSRIKRGKERKKRKRNTSKVLQRRCSSKTKIKRGRDKPLNVFYVGGNAISWPDKEKLRMSWRVKPRGNKYLNVWCFPLHYPLDVKGMEIARVCACWNEIFLPSVLWCSQAVILFSFWLDYQICRRRGHLFERKSCIVRSTNRIYWI